MTIEQLRVDAKNAGLVVVQESSTKWVCIRVKDECFLARERSEYLALSTGLARTAFL
jgi:hypothetical protein